MQGKRLDRVNQLIKEEVSMLLQRELKDPRLGFVTVTEVETSKDLRAAKIFVSVLGDDAQWKASMAALASARGSIRPSVVFSASSSKSTSVPCSRVLTS